ncbi:MAG TPA: hypothetical protein VN739_05885 [Nitrososphaerales archaeon]|nr:hypothetical protein [Nitrososphaerales archaeon]
MNKIDSGIFVHPWDIVHEGAEQVLETISDLGVSRINLATSYHAGRYILPRDPKQRVFHAEEGVVYFKPDPGYFVKSLLKPIRSSKFADVDVVELVTQESKKYNLGVNSWTVTLHNSNFAKSHPELAVVDAFGDVDQNFICPSHKETIEYVKALVQNLAGQYDLNAIQLESIGYPWSLKHNDQHEIFGSRLEPLVSELITTCFCDNCTELMSKSNLKPEEMKKLVVKIVDTSLRMPSNVMHSVPPEEIMRNAYVLSSDIDLLHDLLKFKHGHTNETLQEVRNALRDIRSRKTQLRLLAQGGSSMEFSVGRGCEGINLSSASKILDGIDLVTYVKEPENVYYQVLWTKFEIQEACSLHASLRINFPITTSRGTLEAEMNAALEAGATGLEFYNYGWTNKKGLEWLKKSLSNVANP